MQLLWAYLLVFIAAGTPWIEVLLVASGGVLAGLAPLPVVIVATAGNVATLVPVVYAGDRIRLWWRRRRRSGETGPPSGARAERAQHLFERYGLPGLAVLGPLVTGIHLAAVVALAAGARRGPTLLWLSAGIGAWATAAATMTVLGLDIFAGAESSAAPAFWPGLAGISCGLTCSG